MHHLISLIYVDLKINGAPLRMELYTGADITSVSEKVWKEQLRAFPLQDTKARLRMYTGEPLKLRGEAHVTVNYDDQVTQLLAQGSGPFLLGKNWFGAIRLNWSEIKKVTTS